MKRDAAVADIMKLRKQVDVSWRRTMTDFASLRNVVDGFDIGRWYDVPYRPNEDDDD